MATNETVDIDLNVKTNLPGTIADLKQMKLDLKSIKDMDTFRQKKQEIDDLEDSLKSAKTGAGNFAEVLGTIPGPLGAIGSQVGGTLQSLKQFGALKFSDIKSSFTELGKDVIDAGKGIANLTGLTKVYSFANNALSKSFFGVAAGETAAATAAGVLTAALAATGITLLIGAVALLVEAYKDWAGGAEKAAEAQKQLNERAQKGVEAATNATLAFNKSQEEIDVKRAKAAGKTEGDIQKIRENAAKDRIRIQQDALAKLQNIQGADTTAAADAVMTAQDDLTKIQLDGIIAKNAKIDAVNKEQQSKDKQNLETINKNAKEATNSLLTEREQARQKITDDYAAKIKLAKQYNKDTYVLEEAEKKAQAELADKFRKEDSAKEREKQFEDIQGLIDDLDYQNQLIEGDYAEDQQRLANKGAYLAEQKNIELSNTELTEKERNEIIKKYAKLEKDIDKDLTISKQAEHDARIAAQVQFLDAIGNLFGALSGLFEQGTAASKAFALAEIGIGVAKGYIQGLDIAQKGAKALGPAAPFAFPIFYATQIAAVLSAAAKARQILSNPKSAGSGGGGTATTVSQPPLAAYGGALSMATPQITGTEAATPGSQIAQTLAMSSGKPVRAYVVSGDISSQQALDRKTNRGATFGLG